MNDLLTNIINFTFTIGLLILMLGSIMAVVLSGSFDLFLAGFSKKTKNNLSDRIKLEERKKDGTIDQESLEYYEKLERRQKDKKRLWIRYPLLTGGGMVLLSFLLSLFYL